MAASVTKEPELLEKLRAREDQSQPQHERVVVGNSVLYPVHGSVREINDLGR